MALAALVLVVGGMTGLSFAAVPLYRLFCQVTGFGGTTQTATAAPNEVSDRLITVRFNSDVDPDLPWAFRPVQRKVSVKVGEEKLAFYEATNRSEETLVGKLSCQIGGNPPLAIDLLRCGRDTRRHGASGFEVVASIMPRYGHVLLRSWLDAAPSSTKRFNFSATPSSIVGAL